MIKLLASSLFSSGRIGHPISGDLPSVNVLLTCMHHSFADRS